MEPKLSSEGGASSSVGDAGGDSSDAFQQPEKQVTTNQSQLTQRLTQLMDEFNVN